MGSILAAPERFDFLGEQDLSGRLGLIKAIHGHLQANEAVLADESPGDLRRPGDTSRPFKFKNSELLSQTRFWAALWPLDLDRLQTIHDRLRDDQRGFPRIFFLSLGVLHEFVWWFTRDPKEARQFQVARKDAQRRKTYIRDGGVCCITGRDVAEGCHIIPFWTLTRPDRSYVLVNRLKGLLGPEFALRLEEILMSDIDTPDNIIFLSRQLQSYWAMGIFALEPLGYDSRLKESADDTLLFDAPLKTPTAKRRLEGQGENESNERVPPAEGKEKATLEYCIKLRFHWLPKTSISSLRAPLTADILNNSPRPLFVEFDKIQNEFQAACGRAIDTGEIITIWADKRENLPSMEILKLQWLAYLMHRLAGGADPHVYEPPFPDSDDLGQLEMLQRDHTELQRLQKRMADLKIPSTSSILGATGRYDFLDDDLSIRRGIIQDIHRLLQANTALLKKENRGDVAKPGDNSRPVMFNSRDVINQARFWAALCSLERPRLDAIHRSLLANEDGFPGDLMESLGMVHEFVWW
ncbi:hypothetical protein K4K49_003764, partial [Colletotrichum sp. SAR 10_70]